MKKNAKKEATIGVRTSILIAAALGFWQKKGRQDSGPSLGRKRPKGRGSECAAMQ